MAPEGEARCMAWFSGGTGATLSGTGPVPLVGKEWMEITRQMKMPRTQSALQLLSNCEGCWRRPSGESGRRRVTFVYNVRTRLRM